MTALLIPDHNGSIALALAAALLLTAGIIRHLIVQARREDMTDRPPAPGIFEAADNRHAARLRAELDDDNFWTNWIDTRP